MQTTLRFYAELTDFLGDEESSGQLTRAFDISPSVKDLIESCGVPHTEVDLIIVDGTSVDFSYRVRDSDHISVYPMFESFDVSPIVEVRPEPLRDTRFVADNHLGKLARFLRLLGFDTSYDQDWTDPELVSISVEEARILLTRDVELLKHGALTHGYCLRATDPREQLVEVVRRFHLEKSIRAFSRCMKCNGTLHAVDKAEVSDLVPPRTRESVDVYKQCTECGQVYWPGSHHPALMRIVESARPRGPLDPSGSTVCGPCPRPTHPNSLG